jgi:hypothetical protein
LLLAFDAITKALAVDFALVVNINPYAVQGIETDGVAVVEAALLACKPRPDGFDYVGMSDLAG